MVEIETINAGDADGDGVGGRLALDGLDPLKMTFVFLVPAQYLLAEVVIADLADELSLHAQPPYGHARVCDRPASDDDALAHVDHFSGHEHVGHFVDLAVDEEGGDEVQAGMPSGNDFKIPCSGHSRFLVPYKQIVR